MTLAAMRRKKCRGCKEMLRQRNQKIQCPQGPATDQFAVLATKVGYRKSASGALGPLRVRSGLGAAIRRAVYEQQASAACERLQSARYAASQSSAFSFFCQCNHNFGVFVEMPPKDLGMKIL